MKMLSPSILLLAVFFASCEKPEVTKAAPEPKVEPKVDAPAAPPVAEPKVAPKAEPAKPEPLENAEPFVSVQFEGKQILIKGSIKSKLQKATLLKHLGEAFPDHEVTDDLEVDYRRVGVGWGNRFSDGYVIPFFRLVNEGTFAYKDGVVILKGEVSDQRVFKKLVMVAGEVFMGDFTQDIDTSELVVKVK